MKTVVLVIAFIFCFLTLIGILSRQPVLLTIGLAGASFSLSIAGGQ